MNSAAPIAIDFDAAAAPVRVSLFADYHEVWQGTIGELCSWWNLAEARPTPSALAEQVGANPEGIDVLVGSLPESWFSLDLRNPKRVLKLKRTHYYQDQKTGSLYAVTLSMLRRLSLPVRGFGSD